MHDRTGTGDVRGNTTDDQTSTRKLVQNYVSFVDKKPQFEIDLQSGRSISRRYLSR